MSQIILSIASEIIKNNLYREYKTLSKYACKSGKGLRRYPNKETIPDKYNIRSTFFHDTDRILHSLAYTRYIDKTQAFFLFDNDHITHRVLHVQLVSKIARTIGRFLRLNEDLIEAISLAHDIGHVPYGHDGERCLNDICKKHNLGCFCHNAQSVRALMELENHGEGLNLTLQVLDGVLCHNGEILSQEYSPQKNKDWDQFLYEYESCWRIEGLDKQLKPMTLEGCVVRISDVIAYIGRDIEDAIVVNLIRRDDIPEDIVEILGNTNRDIVNNLIIDVINNSYNKNYITFSGKVYFALEKLKDFNYQNIYFNPKKTTQNYKIEKMFTTLFEKYINDLNREDRNSSIYTDFLKDMNDNYKQNNKKEKIVLDFIAGMTDDYFNKEYEDYIMPKSYGLRIN
ncbi:MAG TPA: phosphohydrolase [Ruminiclostridium sp.]|jgi:dGTPase|nr:HD domain-containing protein [Clostridiaceae bacterium]HAA25572.1 phosphohydrolase [Ruminiclostridium sp.]